MKSKIFAILIIVLLSCSPSAMQKSRLVPAGRDVAKKSPFGSYVEATAPNGIFSGEYIAFQNDTLYVLTIDKMCALHMKDVHYINLVLTRTKTKRYVIGTGVAVIPALIGAAVNPDYAGDFLAVGGITLLTGGLAALIESGRKGQEVHYNGTQGELTKSSKFARFPNGIPDGVNPMEFQAKY